LYIEREITHTQIKHVGKVLGILLKSGSMWGHREVERVK